MSESYTFRPHVPIGGGASGARSQRKRDGGIKADSLRPFFCNFSATGTTHEARCHHV